MAVIDRLMNALRPSQGSTLQDWLDSAADMGDKRIDGYSLYRKYYNGDIGAKLRDRARQYLRRHGVEFCENFTDVVVDTLAERLEIVGFKSSLANGDQDPLADEAWSWWQTERLDQQQNTIHTETLMLGDGAVAVEWDDDEGRPCVERQKPDQVKFVYSSDAPDEVEYAVKVWKTTRVGPSNPTGRPVRRMNIYWYDRCEKWYRLDQDNSPWEAWQDEDDSGWPVWLTDTGESDGEPLGIPLIHFRHKPLGDSYGRSRVKGAIAFQEQLNKYAADLNDLIDNHALPQRTATGVSGAVTYAADPGTVWQAQAPEAKFGQLEASDTANLLNAIEGVLSRLARKTRIPMHLLTGGTPPSGESLKTAESGLVASAKLAQVEFGNAWEDVMLMALKLNNLFGGGPALEPGVRLESVWDNPATRSEADDVTNAIAKKQLGVSKATLLRELGYDPETELAASQAETQAEMEVQAKAFDAGTPLK